MENSSSTSVNPSSFKIFSYSVLITIFIILYAFSNAATPLNSGINEILDNSNIIMLNNVYFFCIWCFVTFVILIITMKLIKNNIVFV
jgi:hypothetical protein